MPRWRQMAEEADRDAASLSVTVGGAPEDLKSFGAAAISASAA
jgi:hypothetical protein